MRICLDTNVVIEGLRRSDSPSAVLLDSLSRLEAFVAPQVVDELYDNLSRDELKRLFSDVYREGNPRFVYEPVPDELIAQYVEKGLSLKGDAMIAAFAEHLGVEVVVSLNRDFLRLAGGPFEVLTPQELLDRLSLENR